MSNSKKPNMKYNASGCEDTTAYQAIKNVQREERRQLIADLKALACQHGYKIVSTIELKEIESDVDG